MRDLSGCKRLFRTGCTGVFPADFFFCRTGVLLQSFAALLSGPAHGDECVLGPLLCGPLASMRGRSRALSSVANGVVVAGNWCLWVPPDPGFNARADSCRCFLAPARQKSRDPKIDRLQCSAGGGSLARVMDAFVLTLPIPNLPGSLCKSLRALWTQDRDEPEGALAAMAGLLQKFPRQTATGAACGCARARFPPAPTHARAA